MTNRDVLRVAMEQSAIDSGCLPGDFLKQENIVVISRKNDSARKYLSLPFVCDLCSYGNNIVASVAPELKEDVGRYINSYPAYHCFETPNMHVLARILEKQGAGICFQAEYFLPDLTLLSLADGAADDTAFAYHIKLLGPDDFPQLYLPEWSNALSKERKHLDRVAVGAYQKDGKLIGLAGASADCDTMWQIGVDVLPEFRRQGIASVLTRRLAVEILKRGKVPFYCCAWSNVASARNAIRSGFRPGWVQLTAKPWNEIDRINRMGKQRDPSE